MNNVLIARITLSSNRSFFSTDIPAKVFSELKIETLISLIAVYGVLAVSDLLSNVLDR